MLIEIIFFVTMIGSIIGIGILIIAFIKLFRIKKEFENLIDEECFSEEIILKRRKIIILYIIGLFITSTMQLIRIFI